MTESVTNLLPYGRLKHLRKQYWFRLGTVAALLMTALVGVSAVLLLPTYVLLTKKVDDKKAVLAASLASPSSVDEKQLSERLSLLTSHAATLETLARAPSVSTRITALLAVSRPGITLSGFTYTPASPKGSAKNTLETISISGKAVTRDALHTFQLALQNTPFISSAVLPVSAYALSSDVPFTIALTLAP